MLAAVAVSTAVNKYNAPIDDKDFQVRIGGLGIAYGSGIRHEGTEVRGRAVDDAFMLGEDTADGGQILVTKDVKERLKASKVRLMLQCTHTHTPLLSLCPDTCCRAVC